jgi:hypothetical protein
MRFGGVIAGLVAGLVCVPGALSVPPSNDDFADAWEVSGPFASVNAGNAEATKEPGEPNHAGNAGGASVWFVWTAPRNGRALLHTCENNFDTLLAVYTGDSLSTLVEVVSNDNGCASGSGSAVELAVSAGAVYRIAVDGRDGAGDRFWLEVRMRPANDNFADAEELLGLSWFGTGLATREAGELQHRGSPGSGSVWYRWTAPYDLTMELRLCTVSFDAVTEIYTGNTPGTLTPVPTQELGCGDGQILRFEALAGTTYRIVVDGAGSDARGSGELELASVSVAPENLAPPSITGAALEGEILSGDQGRWRYARAYSRFWERCNGSGCTVVKGDGGLTYQLHRADIGSTIRLRVVAWTSSHSTTAISNSIGPILARPPLARPPQTPSAPPARQSTCRVPRVIGQTLRRARISLTRSRCRLGSVRRVRSARKAGLIVRQTPRAGTRLRAGGRVNVRVSLGRRR